MTQQSDNFKDKYTELIGQYSKKFVHLSSPVVQEVLKLLNEGMAVDQAVSTALLEHNFFGRNADILMSILFKATAYGFGIDPKKVANPETVKRILLHEAWAPDKMNLSTRLHGTSKAMRQEIIDTISSAMRQQKAFTGMARDLYDGYNSGQQVINKADLPNYLDRLQRAARKVAQGDNKTLNEFNNALDNAKYNVDKLASNGAPTKALKAAYSQLVKSAESLSERALDKAIHTAIEEKSRYLAERIARTEISAAWGEAFFTKQQGDPDVIAYRWILSSRHPRFDICDLHANADFYGLGKGVYPKNKFPKRPAHPHCYCPVEQIYEGEIHIDFSKEADILDNATFKAKEGNEYLNGLSEQNQKQLLGLDGWKAWKQDGEWQKYLRSWNGHSSPKSRFKGSDFSNQVTPEKT